MAHFHALVDPRKARGKRYALVTLLVLVFLAKLSGMDGPSAIADWCQGRTAELVKLLGLSYAQMPSHHTIRRLFDTLLDETAFEERMQAYTTQQREKQPDTGVRVMDDKRLRGTLPPGETQGEATMAWYDPERQEVLAQQKIDPDEGEIPTGEKLLEQADLHAKIVLADALHTQRKLCQHIGQAQGDYCFLAISGWRSARCMASPMVYDLVPANTGERTAAEMIIDPCPAATCLPIKAFWA